MSKLLDIEIEHILRISDPDKKSHPELSPHYCGGQVSESDNVIFCEKCGKELT